MKRTLVLIGGGHLTLYKKGLESFFKKDVFLEIFSLNDPRKELDIFDRLKFRFNTNGFRDDYYKAKKHEILNKIKNFEQVLFINLGYDSSFFFDSEMAEALQKKDARVLFVDSMKRITKPFMFWDCFHKIFSFEYDDVRFARDKLGLSVEYVPVGTNYNFYKVAPICKPEYDICFVGISVPKRLEYLQAIAELAERKNYSLWISGHFWHTNNFLNYLVGKIKFKWKHPLLAKYIKNIFVQPQELAVIYSKSKICLNINVSYHKSFNTRNFDIMYSNRLLISDAEDLTGIDIVPNRDFIMCKDIADMVSKIDYYLQHEELADEIRKNGKKIVEQKYLFIQTLDKVLS